MKLRLLLLAAILMAAAAALSALWVTAPYARFERRAFVDIPKGAGTRGIARALARAGVIQDPLQFFLIRLVRPRARLQAGEYAFERPAEAWEVFDRIARGDIFYYSFTVPEGQNVFDIAAALDRVKIMRAAPFLRAVQDAASIRDLDPKAPSLEGYLFPDTYRVPRRTTPAQLCRMMTDRFRLAWKDLEAPKDANVHDVVTLASLVEREARVPGERPAIASVYRNRLRINMALQCDPTTIYAALLEDRYRGAIYRSDLDSRQSYNTYQHPGLPPGPIANPGVESLRAALYPAKSEYLYFVLKPGPEGAHVFSKELAEHQAAVRKYRRGLREAQQANGTHSAP
jgi:UPF0755 protein